jgi:peptide deformylase
MTARLILKYPDSKLRGDCEAVLPDEYETSVPQWCQDLRDTMIANLSLGLAGPQIGIKKRIFAISSKGLDNPGAFRSKSSDDGIIYIINPVLSMIDSDKHGSVEACLSIPGAMYKIRRSSAVHLTYSTPQKELITAQITGEDAVIVQHKYDHLAGKLFVDKLNSFDKKEFKKLYESPKRKKSEGEINQIREQKRAKSRSNRKKQ